MSRPHMHTQTRFSGFSGVRDVGDLYVKAYIHTYKAPVASGVVDVATL